MSMKIPTQIEKCKGAMLATAIGDALGWPNEPCSKNRIKKPKVMDNFVGWIRCSNNPRWHDGSQKGRDLQYKGRGHQRALPDRQGQGPRRRAGCEAQDA